MTVVVGTAGHIDHGKTALLRALTGIDADRLPEERRRGMTIDVGYAHLLLPDGDALDFVDVPGHDRLVGNMLVGAGEIDAALLVVAADDGPRAQTLEHLELLDALGIDVGAVAVTKVDAVVSGRPAEVIEAVRTLLAGTSLAGAPLVAVSSLRGDGLDSLREALVSLRDRVVERRAPRSWPTFWIDRVFTVRGRGLVVTGSLRGGSIARGDTLRLEPGGRSVRVRELQVHGATVEAVRDGGRVALNLAIPGDAGPAPERGDALTADPGVQSTSELVAVLRPTAPRRSAGVGRPGWPPAQGAHLQLHLGTVQVQATMGHGPRAAADVGDGRRIVRMRVARPIPAREGDRFVLRRPSPGGAVAGGVVVDPSPPVGPSRRRVSAANLVGLAGSTAEAAAARLAMHGAVHDPAHDRSLPDWMLADDVERTLRDFVVATVAATGAEGVRLSSLRSRAVRHLRRGVTLDEPTAAAIVARALDELAHEGAIRRDGDLVLPAGVQIAGPPAGLLEAMDRLERSLAVTMPPALGDAARAAGCPPDGIRALEASGRIVRLDDDLAYAANAFAELEATALRLASGSEPLTPAVLRDASGTSRRYVMAILEELDRRGVLRRTPDGHVPGHRSAR